MEGIQIAALEDAGILRRLFAFLLDIGFIYSIPIWLDSLSPNELRWQILIAFGIPFTFTYYQTYLIYKVGQTVGGKIMGIQVVTVDGLSVPLRKSFLRGLFLAIIFAPVDAAIVLSIMLALAIVITMLLPPDPKIGKRRHILDQIAGTCVVRAPKRKSDASRD